MRKWWRFGTVACALVSTACQAVGGSLTEPGSLTGALPSGGTVTPGATSAPTPGGSGTGLVDRDRIHGTLSAPDSRLIGNNSSSLIDLGTPAFFRIMAAGLQQKPLAGATVTLVEASGSAVATDSAMTDASGSYSIPVKLAKGAFVHAEFSADGKDFAFEAPVPPATGDVLANVDAASTLVAGKIKALLARDQRAFEKVTPASIKGLIDNVVAALEPGNIPYMAKGAKDPIPAFDQLLQDVPGIKSAAAFLGEDALAPSFDCQVSTVVSQDLLAGIALPAGTKLSSAGDFDLGDQDTIFVPTVGNPVQILRLTADGAAAIYGTLPAGVANPVRIAIASGSLYVAGVDQSAHQIQLFSGGGQMTELASYDTQLTAEQFFERGRLAIGPDGSITLPGADGKPTKIPPPSRTVQDVYIPPIVIPTVPPIAIPTVPPIIVPTPVPVPEVDAWASGSIDLDYVPGLDGNLYVSQGDDAIIGYFQGGAMHTLAGQAGQHGYRNGRGTFALFDKPREIAVDKAGNKFVADPGAHRIRRTSAEGMVFNVAGTGTAGVTDGVGSKATVNTPRFLRTDANGALYFLDTDPATGKERLRKIVLP